MSTKWDSLLAISRQLVHLSSNHLLPFPLLRWFAVWSMRMRSLVSCWLGSSILFSNGGPRNTTWIVGASPPVLPPLSLLFTQIYNWALRAQHFTIVCVCVCVYVCMCVCVCVCGVCVSRVLLFCGPCLICISISKQSFTDTANVRVVWWCVNTEWGVASCQLDNTSNDPALKRIKWINGNMQGVSLPITMCSYNLCSIQCA